MLQAKTVFRIDAKPVPASERVAFLPQHFGPAAGTEEGRVTLGTIMAGLAPDYAGGYWEFYRLTNGGFYLAPLAAPRWNLVVASSGFNGVLSSNATGVVVTLFTLVALAIEYDDSDLGGHMAVSYYRLLDYAAALPESRLILRAIGAKRALQ